MKKHIKKISKQDKKRNTIAIIVLLLVVFSVSISLLNEYINKKNKDSINDENEIIVDDSIKTSYSPGIFKIDGRIYNQSNNIKNILLVGANENDAEYILLIVINKDNETIVPIHIPRNTVCDYYIQDSFGKIVAEANGQIEKSFGNRSRDLKSLNNVKATVEKMMCNIQIDYCMMFDLDSVDDIVGVTGPISFYAPDSYDDGDVSFNKGDNIVIDKYNAVSLIKSDESREDIDVIERRQSKYIVSLYDLCRENYIIDNGYFIDTFAKLSENVIFSSNDISYLLGDSSTYTNLNLVNLKGTIEEDGFIIDKDDIRSICLRYIYDY